MEHILNFKGLIKWRRILNRDRIAGNWSSKEVFQVCLIYLIACIGNGRAAPKVGGMYQGRTKEATIILEEVVSRDLWIGMLSLACLVPTTI